VLVVLMTMVDSREDETVADRIDRLTERVTGVEDRLEVLAGSLAELSASVDRRFDDMDRGVLEQREYTEFAFERLRTEMNERFASVDKRFDAADSRFARLERKLDQYLDVTMRRNELIERRLDALERRKPST
jgi:hypothetical protein